ncbi:MAG: RraA family protein [Pseudomonadota bacterium]
MPDIALQDLERLADWDTPTICNALEALDPSYRLSGYTVKAFTCLRPDQKPVVGYARTATIRASAKPAMAADKVTALRLDYYDYVDTGGPKPSVVVIQDLDTSPGRGAFWGEVNTNIHKGLGALGVVTNGSIRDLADSAEGFQALAGQVGPSHAWVHITGFGDPVEVHGMAVKDGDIIHADVHGAVIVPPDLVTELPAAIEAIAAREAVLLSAAQEAVFDSTRLRLAFEEAAGLAK